MSIETALAKLRRRNPNFSTLKAALNFNSLPTSNSWANLERKFAEMKVPAMVAATNASKLEKIYRDNVEWGDKAVQFAVFDETMAVALQDVVARRFTPEFVPVAPFPAYVSEEELGSLALQPSLVASEMNGTRTATTLYFYSRAYETHKETFMVDDMRDDASKQRFAGFDQVIGYRQLIFQRIDSVYIDSKSRRIEFRVDTTRLKTFDRMVDALKELKDSFRGVMTNQVDDSWARVPFALTNFFPKIDQLYNDGHGSVIELGHNTPAGAINHGKMRGHQGNMLADPSHVASMEASDTEKFAIQKSYTYYSNTSVTKLRIPGKSADTGAPVPTINTALVEDCIDGKQFDDMMRLLR